MGRTELLPGQLSTDAHLPTQISTIKYYPNRITN